MVSTLPKRCTCFTTLVLGLLVTLHGAAGAAPMHRYTVTVDAAIREVEVRACFDGAPPHHLAAESLDASAALLDVRIEESGKRLEPNGPELDLRGVPADGCVSYRASLLVQGGRHQRSSGVARRVGPDVVTDAGIWLWRPPSLAQDEEVELRFALPEGMSVSAPWRPQRDAHGRVEAYRLGHAPYDWPAAVAFGTFQQHEIAVGEARLRVAVLHGAPQVELALVRQWLMRSAEAVSTLYGRFPLDDVQMIVVPGARGDEPVPSAFVLRGGQPAVYFFINQRKPLADYLADWTAVHEMAHLLLPHVRPEDAWLSEGVASYYQNVLRARAGMISVQEAWQRMHGSFRRAMRSMPGTTLADATERMYRDGAYMRVYWHGAALMLMADQRLRARTQGAQSLDRVLHRLHACCLDGTQVWQASALFDKLDELSATTVFSELYAQHVTAAHFPDLTETYDELGLDVSAGGEIVNLLPRAAHSDDRDAIMRAPASLR